ncbi:MAG: AbrB/MazE/SpoVT family DNA-binding domain-containing protein [Candidatus Bathyarchaeia archaeon]
METRIGKKYAIYIPKAIAKAIDIKEGDRVRLRASGESIVLEIIRDPIELAIAGKKFASVKPEEIEAISIEEQAKQAEDPA